MPQARQAGQRSRKAKSGGIAGTSTRPSGTSKPLDEAVSSPSHTSQLIDLDTAAGRVAGYSVGTNGLIVNLDVSAAYRIAVHVGPEEPHFRSAVSLAMIALNNRVNPSTSSGQGHDQQYLWVSLDPTTKDRKLRPATKVAMSYDNDRDPFDIDEWVFTYEG